VKLTVIGCAGSFPGPDSAASSYLLEAEGFRLLVDMGNGALGALQRQVGLLDIDAVLISHHHPDHCFDVCSYYVARRFLPSGPPPRIPVYGPRRTAQRLARAYGMPSDEGMTDIFDFVDLEPGSLEIGPLRVSVDRVNHPVETYGARFEHDGGSLAYSADTGRSDALVRLARDVDLLLCEASFVEGKANPANLHLTGLGAAEHARAADARSLVLTHLVPWNDPQRVLGDAAAAGFHGAIGLAAVGMSYEL
jgi:ribonuclease BN (tRNA processing enzyme)